MKDQINPEALLIDYYELAYHAHSNTSFSPERRAKDVIESHSQELSEDLETIIKFGSDPERYKAGYIKKFCAWMGAKTRCFSIMITGPSGVNLRQHEKANNAEHNRSVEFINWRAKVLKAITKPENTDIIKGSDGAIEKMEAKLEGLEDRQEMMKACNKIARDKKENKELRLMELGLSNTAALKILLPPRYSYEKKGFQGFYLTNNGACIRNLKKDIEAEKNRLAKYHEGNKEYEMGIATVIENVDDNRLQLFFDGKPEDSIRTELKKNGYRWSPRNECWQRQLTENALWGMKRLTFLSAS